MKQALASENLSILYILSKMWILASSLLSMYIQACVLGQPCTKSLPVTSQHTWLSHPSHKQFSVLHQVLIPDERLCHMGELHIFPSFYQCFLILHIQPPNQTFTTFRRKPCIFSKYEQVFFPCPYGRVKGLSSLLHLKYVQNPPVPEFENPTNPTNLWACAKLRT